MVHATLRSASHAEEPALGSCVIKAKRRAAARPITQSPTHRITRSPNHQLLSFISSDCQFAENLAVHRVLRERLVHFVPALLRPVHFLFRRRVPFVLRRV